ncbi:MAG TPA: pilus assembly protein [Candidatus Omnitrophota bacterium]|nr:pilus assembly protein [Candidatus Omnitrophota bacterium]
MIKLNQILRTQKGTALVTTLIFTTPMFCMMSLAIDAGYLIATQTELQNASDAAALAVMVDLSVEKDKADRIAMSFASRNSAGSASVGLISNNVILGNYDFDAQKFHENQTPFNACRVRATRDENVPAGKVALFFAKMFGQEEMALSRRAVAARDQRVVGVKANGHLMPITVLKSVVDQDGDGSFDVNQRITLSLEPKGPGNFGYLDLDSGSNDIPELRQYIESGFDQDFVIPESGSLQASGLTGSKGQALLSDLTDMIGKIAYYPVYTTVVEQGSLFEYTIVSIVALRILSVNLTGAMGTRGIQAEIVESTSSSFIVRENSQINTTMQKLRLVE